MYLLLSTKERELFGTFFTNFLVFAIICIWRCNMKLQGVPITNFNKNMQITDRRVCDLYSFIQVSKCNRSLFIIDDCRTWADDICFDYKHKKCYLPYYKFKITPLPEGTRVNEYSQFFDGDDGLYIRYEYELHTLDIELNKVYKVYFELENVYAEVVFDRWIDDKEIDNNKLYQLYINSCFYPTELDTYNKGYHFIDKETKKLHNYERRVRKKFKLDDFSPYNQEIPEYRDVRWYKLPEIINKVQVTSIENFKLRRLDFESYLYCCLRQGLSNSKFDLLDSSYAYFKIGKQVPLIVKGYWKDSYNYEKYSWKKSYQVKGE